MGLWGLLGRWNRVQDSLILWVVPYTLTPWFKWHSLMFLVIIWVSPTRYILWAISMGGNESCCTPLSLACLYHQSHLPVHVRHNWEGDSTSNSETKWAYIWEQNPRIWVHQITWALVMSFRFSISKPIIGIKYSKDSHSREGCHRSCSYRLDLESKCWWPKGTVG